MCGIVGIVSHQGAPVEAARLRHMGDLLAHRGPDDSDVWTAGPVGFCHRRLSIIDLSERGRQPMTVEGVVLVFNGEIYNYRELREELEPRGHHFVSDSDSEVLLRAYLEWGHDCVQRFNGMWAFAIWDPRTKELFCSRDRFGVKPFYYARRNGELRFASEPKALLGDDPALRQLHPKTLARFLSEGLLDDENETFYKDILVLPAAHSLVLRKDGQCRQWRYWNLDPQRRLEAGLEHAAQALGGAPTLDMMRKRALSFPTGPQELERDANFFTAVEALRALLTDAVRLRLRSDVPVGTCLSGGLDSTSIVCLASAMLTRPMSTFSSIYQEKDCNENDFIETVVKGCQTQANLVHPRPEELPEVFSELCWHQDEPTAGPGLYSQWKVMQAAHGKVKVLLDGQGGDELLAGYHPYFEDYLWSLASSKAGSKQIAAELGPLQELTGRDYSPVVSKARGHYRWPAALRNLKKPRAGKVKPPGWVTPEFLAQFRAGDDARGGPSALYDDRLNQRLYHDLTRTSIPGLLRYEDRNSMAFSIEARTPFLDYRLVEFCFALPAVYKIHLGQTKRILRKAMSGLIPRSVVERQDKMGYPTPASHWFRGPLQSWVEDTLRSQHFASMGLFQVDQALAILESHKHGDDRSWELWRFLAVDSWHHQFVEGRGFSAAG